MKSISTVNEARAHRISAATCDGKRWSLAAGHRGDSEARDSVLHAEITPNTKEFWIWKNFIETWSRKIASGKTLNLKLSNEEARYITHPLDAILIQSVITNALDKKPCTVYVDAFASVGGDTIAAINQFKEATIHAIQPTVNGDDQRFKRLENNITVCIPFISESQNVTPHNREIKQFLDSEDLSLGISVLYLDPPWCLDPTNCAYSTPFEIQIFLYENVFKTLKNKRISPSIVVFKLPGVPKNPSIEAFMSEMTDGKYTFYAFMAPRKKYAVYIFRLTELDPSEDDDSGPGTISSQTPTPPRPSPSPPRPRPA
jgi:hypothetical protein